MKSQNLAIILLLIHRMCCSNILVLFNVPSLSNHIMYRPIIQSLAQRGHQIHLVTTHPTSEELNNKNITVTDVHDVSTTIWNSKMENISIFYDSHVFKGVWKSIIRDMPLAQYSTPQMKDIFEAKKYKYDLILGAYIFPTNFLFTTRYNTPMVGIHPTNVPNLMHYMMGNSFHFYYYTDTFQHAQRPPNTIGGIIDLYILIKNLLIDSTIAPMINELWKEKFNEDVKVEAMVNNLDMLLITLTQTWAIPRAVLPNTVFTSDTHLKPCQPLDQTLKDWLDNSKEGVVFFSLGSNIKTTALSQDRVQAIVEGISNIPFKVLLKWESEPPKGLGPNVKIAKWFSQHDLLAHPNVKVFVTHAGGLSISEAIYNRVPVVAIPFFSDQYFNAYRVNQEQIGKILDFTTMTADELTDVITEVGLNEKYRKNIAALSIMIADQPFPPLDITVWWLEHIIRHKGGHHLKPEKIRLYEYLYLDIIGASMFICSTMILGLYYTNLILFNLYTHIKKKKNLSLSGYIRQESQK